MGSIELNGRAVALILWAVCFSAGALAEPAKAEHPQLHSIGGARNEPLSALSTENFFPCETSRISNPAACGTVLEEELQLREERKLLLTLDKALRFDGKDDFIHIPNFQGLPRDQITVAAWVKIRRHRNWNRIVSHNWITNGWNLFTDGSGVVHFGIGQQNKDYAASRITHRDRWHYLVGTYDGETVRVYVDGEEGVNAPLRAAELDDRGSVFIGGGEWDPFNGDISEVRIWSYAQGPQEIRQNMFRPPNLSQSLIGLHDFTDTAGGVVSDKSLYQNHGALGTEHRAPEQVVSNTPVVTPCVVQSEGATGVLTQLHELGLQRIESVRVVRRSGGKGLETGTRQQGVSQSDPVLERGYRVGLEEDVGLLGRERSERFERSDEGATDNESAGCQKETCLTKGNFTQETKQRKAGNLVTSLGGLNLSGILAPACLEMVLADADVDHDVSAATRRKVVHVDVLESEEQCRIRPLHRNSCWGVRTELHFVRPALPPPAVDRPVAVEHVTDEGAVTSAPRVSVVIPVYNAGKDLPEAVESIVNQTFEDWELILVNDGSTDNSADVIKELEQRLVPARRVRVVTKGNGGLADARNAGAHVAAAEWILPLDADDMIEKTFLEKAFRIIDGNQSVNLVIADFRGFGDWEYVWEIPPFSGEDLPYTNMFHCSGLFQKTLWVAAGGYPTTTLLGYEDWAFWIAANQATPLVPHRVEEDLFLARMRRDSMHRKLMWYQAFSVASMRILFPGLYTVEMLIDAHAVFLDAPAHIAREVEKKVALFPPLSQPRLMRGLIREGQLRRAGVKELERFDEVLEDYRAADGLASREDWQPKWRLGLMHIRVGRRGEGERLIQSLGKEFDGMDAALSYSKGALT